MFNPKFKILLLLALVLVINACKKSVTPLNESLLINEWIEKYEDRQSYLFKFVPISTKFEDNTIFRKVLKFQKPNVLSITFLGRSGKTITSTGTWRIVSNDILELNYDNDYVPNFIQKFQIEVIANSELRILEL